MQKIERMISELLASFGATSSSDFKAMIANALDRARANDIASAYWILRAFGLGWDNCYTCSGDCYITERQEEIHLAVHRISVELIQMIH